MIKRCSLKFLTIWTELGHGHIVLAFYVGIALITRGEASIGLRAVR